jgi:hypothetical protein
MNLTIPVPSDDFDPLKRPLRQRGRSLDEFEFFRRSNPQAVGPMPGTRGAATKFIDDDTVVVECKRTGVSCEYSMTELLTAATPQFLRDVDTGVFRPR